MLFIDGSPVTVELPNFIELAYRQDRPGDPRRHRLRRARSRPPSKRERWSRCRCSSTKAMWSRWTRGRARTSVASPPRGRRWPPRRPPRDPHGATPLLEQVRDLAALIVEHGLTEIEVERAGTRIRVARERVGVAPGIPGGERGRPGVARAGVHGQDESAVPPTWSRMEAPMVGTFYRAANPEAPPYVNEGDQVKQGQVLCIIEAMKLMNEIEAQTSGRVARILVENAQPVEYGQPLLLIDPRA